MRIPESLASLADLGIIEEVVRPLMSGKEAQVYLVVASGEQRVAKIYKEAQNRTFKHRAEYTEGRKTRNTRDQRAIGKRTAHGRAQDEAAWRSTEVDTIFSLQRAGVRVPVPYTFIDGVLIMELITDADGNPAPRLGDVALSAEAATAIYDRLLREVVRMLCAGVVHGDLSDFNVLMAADGPVLIDFPQSVDPAHNPNARKLLLRDVNNLHDFVGRFARHQPRLPFAEEMWELYQANGLTPDTPLSGRYRASTRTADVGSVLSLIDEANRDEQRRREFLGIKSIPASLSQDRRPANQRRPPRPDERHRPADPPRTPHSVAARPAGPARPHAQTHRSGPARPHGQAHPPGTRGFAAPSGAPNGRKKRRHRKGPPPSRK
jgi:RIO kinase 1